MDAPDMLPHSSWSYSTPLEMFLSSCFASGTASRVGGVSFERLAADQLALHAAAYGPVEGVLTVLPDPGDYHFRSTPNHEVRAHEHI
jgi:hypothetical protein